MDVFSIKVGTKFEFEIISDTGKKIGQTYTSQLLDIIDAENIIIATPIHEARMILIPTGAAVKIMFSHDIHGLLSFMGTVTAKSKKENIHGLVIQKTSDFMKIQRRRHFRLECFVEAQYCICTNEENKSQNHGNSAKRDCKNAFTRNISGSGACIISNEHVQKGSLIELTLYLDANNIVKTVSKILRVEKIESAKDKKYELGLLFVKISKPDEDRLIKYIFDQQRQLLKKDVLNRK